MTSTNSSYITVNWDDASNQVHMEYEFRLFYIEILTEDKFKLQLISKNKIATPVAETQFFRSPKSNSTYFLIVLTELEIDNTDSNLFILKFNCTRPNEWKYLKYTKLTGYRLEYNKFFSISCTYLNEYPILVAGLNDFGLIFVNLEDKDFRVIHQLSLKSIDAYILDKITIYKIFKISNNSLRVLIKEMGGFSLYWDKIYIERDKNIFDNLKMSNWINVFENEVASDLVTKTSIGYAQIIYFPINDSLNEACLRIYNLFNKNKSKVFFMKLALEEWQLAILLHQVRRTTSAHLKSTWYENRLSSQLALIYILIFNCRALRRAGICNLNFLPRTKIRKEKSK